MYALHEEESKYMSQVILTLSSNIRVHRVPSNHWSLDCTCVFYQQWRLDTEGDTSDV